tara:strand:- start:1301 stop:1879 length:579 start_codon:yes stop_codon:yes gene_type:complete
VKKTKDKKNNISDEELSLISIISNLENKLEEFDHNLSLMPKNNSSSSNSLENNKEINIKIDKLERQILEINHIISNKKITNDDDKYLSTMPSRNRMNTNKKGYAAADRLRLKRIESIEKKLNDFIKNFSQETSLNTPSKDIVKSEYVMNSNDRYARSRGIFFGFLFSITIIFLLIIVSTESYNFSEFFRFFI